MVNSEKAKRIEIPQVKEYGWELGSEGILVFKPTRKAVRNRVKYIAEQRGTTVNISTTGIGVEDMSKLHQTDIDQIREEMAQIGATEVPNDVTINKSGREEPNLD